MPLKPYENHVCYCGAKLVTSSQDDKEDPNLVLVGCANNACEQGLANVIRMQERTRLLHARGRSGLFSGKGPWPHGTSSPLEG